MLCCGGEGRAGEESLYRGTEKLPGDSFLINTEELWAVIRSQKDLNLPAHKVRCGAMPPAIMASQAGAAGTATGTNS